MRSISFPLCDEPCERAFCGIWRDQPTLRLTGRADWQKVHREGIVMVKSSVRVTRWIAAGAVLFLAIILIALRFNQYGQSAAQAAFQAKRLELVSQTRLALASASEAEKSAVLAVTDEDSQRYADQARAATAQAESARLELQQLLKQGGTARETELFGQFSSIFSEFQRVDSDVLALAVKNTNIKAYNLAFGPAAQAIEVMGTSLSNIVAKSATWPQSRNIAVLALGAHNAALRIVALLAPHIAEESDKKMDELEAMMNVHASEVQKSLEGLADLPKLHEDPDLAAAGSAYRRFIAVKTNILALSRENTNVRSLSISLTEKRKVMLLCRRQSGGSAAGYPGRTSVEPVSRKACESAIKRGLACARPSHSVMALTQSIAARN